MRKIVHYTPSFGDALCYGGPVVLVNELSEALAEAGNDLLVLASNANGASRLKVVLGEYISLGPNLRVLYCNRQFADAKAFGLLAGPFLHSYDKDCLLVSATFSAPLIPTLIAGLMFNKPVGYFPHGSLMPIPMGMGKAWLKRHYVRLVRCLVSRRTVVFCFSELEAQAARKLLDATVVTLPPAVVVPTELVKHEKAGALRLLYLGRLQQIKALENLIEALNMVPRTCEGLSVTLRLVGDGESSYVNGLMELVKELGLSERVAFVPAIGREGLADQFAWADVLVLPSHSENFGRVVAEALAHSVPVLTSHGTPWEIVEKKGLGYWVSNDPATIAKTIAAMTRAELAVAGKRGRTFVSEEFSWSNVVEKMVATMDVL